MTCTRSPRRRVTSGRSRLAPIMRHLLDIRAVQAGDEDLRRPRIVKEV